MSSQSNRAEEERDEHHIISPFAQTTSSIRPMVEGMKISWPLWIVSGALLAIILGNAGYFAVKFLQDPYRTLEQFSADKYLSDFQPMSGSKFRADFKVVADLGWKENVGRLMVFTAPNDSRPIPVMIPPKLSGIYFSKGQTYQIALDVGEGGMIYADSCDKE